MITLEQAKSYLQIEDDTQDTRIQAIVDNVNAWVFSYIWDIKSWNKKELIKRCSVRRNIFWLTHYNPTVLLKINWKVINESDFLIYENWEVEFKNIDLTLITFDAFEVEYIAGVDDYPQDYISVLGNLVATEFYKNIEWDEVKTSKTWPRSVTFKTESEKSIKTETFDTAKIKLKKFIPLHLLEYAF